MSFTLSLTAKSKVNKFITLFKYLKNICPDVMINVNDERFYIQGLCSAHVLMFDLEISNEWFDEYDNTFVNQMNLGVNCEILFKIINCISDGQKIKIEYFERKLDTLTITLENNTNKNQPEKKFELSLMDIDAEFLQVPEIDTDVELSISSDQIVQIINELAQFGVDVKFVCDSNNIRLESTGDGNKMNVEIKDSDIESYAIVEDFVYEGVYSLKYLQNITAFQKLNKKLDILFINENPAVFMYDLNDFDWKDDDIESEDEDGEDENKKTNKSKNTIKFYLAPKMD